MNSLVTVIIPTYKRAPYLRRAIQSVLSQSYSHIEIIIVDDNGEGSDFQKDTERIIQEFEGIERLYYLKQEINKGGSAARNVGVKNSHGEYITFLDDDDFFMPNRIERLVGLMEKENLNIAYSACIFLWNKKIKRILRSEKSKDPMLDILCVKSFMGTGSNMMFRRSIFDRILFDESFRRHQDFEFMLRALELENNNIGYDKYPSVVKDTSNPLNVPNPRDYFLLKKQYLDTFDYLICGRYFKEKNNIYLCNYIECYKAIILSDESDVKKAVINKIREYGKITRTERILYYVRRKLFHSWRISYLIISICSIFERSKLSCDARKQLKAIIQGNYRLQNEGNRI